MFLFTDSQIVDEKMLVYVNDLLSSGEIPDLFAQEYKDEIVIAVRSETKALGLVESTENCWATFIQKVLFCNRKTSALGAINHPTLVAKLSNCIMSNHIFCASCFKFHSSSLTKAQLYSTAHLVYAIGCMSHLTS